MCTPEHNVLLTCINDADVSPICASPGTAPAPSQLSKILGYGLVTGGSLVARGLVTVGYGLVTAFRHPQPTSQKLNKCDWLLKIVYGTAPGRPHTPDILSGGHPK